jgi:hypothetical protein
MSSYHALVLVPGDAGTPVDEACEAAAKLLYPFMHSEDVPEADYHFDWFLQPDDLSEPDDDDRLIWRAGDIVKRFPELQVEAILTPDGRWHEAKAGQLWDDEEWVQKARHLLQRNQDCLALRHLLHV